MFCGHCVVIGVCVLLANVQVLEAHVPWILTLIETIGNEEDKSENNIASAAGLLGYPLSTLSSPSSYIDTFISLSLSLSLLSLSLSLSLPLPPSPSLLSLPSSLPSLPLSSPIGTC